jgi:DNA-binding transcriptional regulator YiaG
MKTTTIEGIGGLRYVAIRHVPFHMSDDKAIGKIIEVDLGDLEKFVAGEILRQQIPLRGQEVYFLRRTLALSMEKFAQALGLTAASIMKWERTRIKRLAPINEAAVRSLAAEKLGVDLPGRFSSLVGIAQAPKKLSLTWRADYRKKSA